ncbi:MAG: hypothetical protein P8I87_00845, partial [Gammaproteobacteria bacterium]|nr:hypothetical protein [Gammaproteobacteria bacterium]
MKSGTQTVASGSSASTTLACRLVKRTPAAIAALVLLSACSAFDQGERPLGPFSGREANTGNESRRSAAEVAANEIAEIASPGSEQQQRLIAEINRVGEQPALAGYREQVPAPSGTPTTLAEDERVELNYEQAELRLVLEQLADSLNMSVVMDPSIDMKVSVRTSSNEPLALDDVW